VPVCGAADPPTVCLCPVNVISGEPALTSTEASNVPVTLTFWSMFVTLAVNV